jgi:hypothetical protein
MEPGITWYEVLGVLPGAAATTRRPKWVPVPDVRGCSTT